jgi:hypothetical protein
MKFPPAYPKWLRSPTGAQLQLDGYCESLKLAVEHHGAYHYKIDRHYSKTKTQLAKRKKVDRYKAKLCRENGVTLIVIPELPTMTPLPNLEALIEKKCRKAEVAIPPGRLKGPPNLRDAYSPKFFAELLEIVSERGGEMLSTGYMGTQSRYELQCEHGHPPWKAAGFSLKRGSWCPTCSRRTGISITEFQELAKSHGGRCLSKKYTSAMTDLHMECSEGHRWWGRPGHLRKGAWCKSCANEAAAKRLSHSIQDMRKLAHSQGGKCVSTVYKNARTKVEWRCTDGHEFEATADVVKTALRHGREWCPACRRAERTLGKRT